MTGRHAVAGYVESLLGREADRNEVRAATLALKEAAEQRRLDAPATYGVVMGALNVLGQS